MQWSYVLREFLLAIQKNQVVVLQKLAQPSSQPGPSSVPIPITLPVVLQCRLFPSPFQTHKGHHCPPRLNHQVSILVRLLEREDSTIAEISYCRSFPNLGMISEGTKLLYQIVAKIIDIFQVAWKLFSYITSLGRGRRYESTTSTTVHFHNNPALSGNLGNKMSLHVQTQWHLWSGRNHFSAKWLPMEARHTKKWCVMSTCLAATLCHLWYI